MIQYILAVVVQCLNPLCLKVSMVTEVTFGPDYPSVINHNILVSTDPISLHLSVTFSYTSATHKHTHVVCIHGNTQ